MKRETHGLAVVTGRLEPAAIDGLVASDDRSRRSRVPKLMMMKRAFEMGPL